MTEKMHKLRLAKVRIRNFVNFEQVEVEFNEQNVFQFVGCNGSGKTSILEAIRRCSESTSNHSFSTIPDLNKTSIVICMFQGNIGNLKSNTKEKETETLKNSAFFSEKLISIYLSWFCENNTRSAIKALIVKKGGNISSEMLYTKLSETKEIMWTPIKSNLAVDILETMLKDGCSFEFIEESIAEQNKSIEMYETSNAERRFDEIFRDLVNIEFLYSFRGISKIQSSDQMPNLAAGEHFRYSTEKSFIITKYLERKNEDYDSELEQNIFKRLTPDDEFSFQFTGEQSSRLLEVKDNKTFTTISILKTPVGVLEAKYLSITLAKKKSGIVIIEEPGRGMHPDMIRRMIYLVFQDKEIMSGKMVIITTHDKNFLTPFTIENTFLCKKRDIKTREVKPLANIEVGARNRRRSVGETPTEKEIVAEKDKYHKRESVECRFLAAIVFSQRIMFLEGESDFILIETIKQLLITKRDLMKSYLYALSCEYKKEVFGNAENDIIQFLASLNVEMMNGVKNMKKINDICYYLGLQENRFFLVDYDVLGTIDKTLSLNFSALKWFNLDILEGKGVFVWDNDDVEFSSNKGCSAGNETEDKGVQCPGILRQDKMTGAGVPPKPGTLEDVVIRFSLQHDKIYHYENGSCNIQSCTGLVKLLGKKEIANLKAWPSYAFSVDKIIFEVNIIGEIEMDKTSSLMFVERIFDREQDNYSEIGLEHNKAIRGKITIKGEGKIKKYCLDDVDISSSDTEKVQNREYWYTHCDGKAFCLVQDNGKHVVCTENSKIRIKMFDINLVKPASKKGSAKYEGRFDIQVESETRNGNITRKHIKCTEPGTFSKEEKPNAQCHKKLCMTEKFLLQNTLTHSDVLEVVEAVLKCSMEYRDGQIWRFLRFLADKALNRKTKISIHEKGGRMIQKVQVTD